MRTSLETRNESYRITDKPRRREQVLNVILAHQGISNRQIAEKLNLPINSVVGRTRELVEDNLVEQRGEIFDSITKRNVALWAKAEEPLVGLFAKPIKEKKDDVFEELLVKHIAISELRDLYRIRYYGKRL